MNLLYLRLRLCNLLKEGTGSIGPFLFINKIYKTMFSSTLPREGRFFVCSVIVTLVLSSGIVALAQTPDPVFGCMDPSATNFNSAATQDDGSCVLAPAPAPAPAPVVSGCT